MSVVSNGCALAPSVSPQKVNEEADQQKNDPKSRWERGLFLTGRLVDGDALHHVDVDKNQTGLPAVYTKELADQHWLELVDGYFISLCSFSILILFIGNTVMDLTVRQLSVTTNDVLNRCGSTVKVRRLVLNPLARMDTTYSLLSGITEYGWRRTQTKTSFDGRLGFLPTPHSHNNLHNHSRLDRGGGKHLSLPQCSREQLEMEVW